MATGKIHTRMSNKIYRFIFETGEVSTGNTPNIASNPYIMDGTFTVSNNKIKCNMPDQNLTIQIITHLIGKTNSNGRGWVKVKGGNIEPQIIQYGEYVSLDNSQIAAVSYGTEIYLDFLESMTLGGGNTGDSYIFITIL